MKTDLLILTEKTKEELIEIILEKQRQIEELEKKLQEKEKSQAHKEFLKNLRLAQRVKHPKNTWSKSRPRRFHPNQT